MSAIALIYHDVLSDENENDSGFPGADAASYKLSLKQFARHLDLIEGALTGRQPARVTDTQSIVGNEPKFLLTFDDGGISAIDRIAGSLSVRGWRGHFFVVSGYLGKQGFLSGAHLRQLHAAGHVVGSHSATHPERISQCELEEIKREWRDSCSRISDQIGAPVVVASVPGGFYSERVACAAAEEGVQVLFTSEPTVTPHRLGATVIAGRFAITRRTSERHLLGLTQGRRPALLRQQVTWAAKKAAKRIGGRAWLAVRKSLFERGMF